MAPPHYNESAINTIDTLGTPDIEMAQAVSPTPPGPSIKEDDPFLVIFSPLDHKNPLNWPTSRKWAVTDILSATGFNRIMVSTIMAPALPLIAKELEMNSTEAVMALSIYLLATAFGPLIIAPLSEIYGRQRILHVSNVWFLIWNIACGFATTKGLLIAARFLAGFGASAIYALAGGVLGDVWRPEQRGRSLGIYLVIPVLGAAVGPIIGGFMAARTTWRWMFWATSIFQAAMIVISFTMFHETYAPCILQKEAKKRRHETGDQRYYTLHERVHASQPGASSILLLTLTRPLRLLLFHPIIQVTSVISAFNYGILYIVLSSFSSLWTDEYGLSVEISGLHYIACAIGEVAGSQLGGPLMDRLFVYMRARSSTGNEHTPEFRIPLTFLGAALVPLGLFMYGWTSQFHIQWAAVDIGIFITMFGMQVASMPLQAYVIDTYMEYTSSALAAMQFSRSLTAFLFPLFAPSMYRALGYGWGNSLLAFASLLIGFPAPSIMWAYGARLRAKAVLSY